MDNVDKYYKVFKIAILSVTIKVNKLRKRKNLKNSAFNFPQHELK